MSDLWRAGVERERRADGSIRHSQVVGTFGPGALVDLVDDAAVVGGLSFWARGERITEDRLVAMLARQEGYGGLALYAPPPSSRDAGDPDRRWIQTFRFPEWFVCQNERCWEEGGGAPRREGARPRRLLGIGQLDGKGHKCKEGKGKSSPVQPVRFVRACKFGHVDDIEWPAFAHRKKPECTRRILWIDEAGATGDLADVRVMCSGCGAIVRMSVAMARFVDGLPVLGPCSGRRPWLGGADREGCREGHSRTS
jgi:hypothetical protein